MPSGGSLKIQRTPVWKKYKNLAICPIIRKMNRSLLTLSRSYLFGGQKQVVQEDEEGVTGAGTLSRILPCSTLAQWPWGATAGCPRKPRRCLRWEWVQRGQPLLASPWRAHGRCSGEQQVRVTATVALLPHLRTREALATQILCPLYKKRASLWASEEVSHRCGFPTAGWAKSSVTKILLGGVEPHLTGAGWPKGAWGSFWRQLGLSLVLALALTHTKWLWCNVLQFPLCLIGNNNSPCNNVPCSTVRLSKMKGFQGTLQMLIKNICMTGHDVIIGLVFCYLHWKH